MASLVTLAYVQAFPGVTASSAILDALRPIASNAIVGYVRRPLLEATVTEYYSGNGCPDLPLRRWPVNTVTSVYLDQFGAWGQKSGSFADAALTAGSDYALVYDGDSSCTVGLLRKLSITASQLGWSGLGYRGWLTPVGIRPGGAWPVGEGNIKITYDAGYSDADATQTYPIPGALQQACAQLIVWMTRNTQYGGTSVVSEGLGKYTVAFGNTGLADSARCALAAAGELGTTRSLLTPFMELSI